VKVPAFLARDGNQRSEPLLPVPLGLHLHAERFRLNLERVGLADRAPLRERLPSDVVEHVGREHCSARYRAPSSVDQFGALTEVVLP